MASRCNEVETTVHPRVRDDLLTHHTILLIEVEVKLIINVIQYWCPANSNIIAQTYNDQFPKFLFYQYKTINRDDKTSQVWLKFELI